MNNDAAKIVDAYNRKRSIYIRECKNLIAQLNDEVMVLEGTEIQPRKRVFDATIIQIKELAAQMEALAQIYPSEGA